MSYPFSFKVSPMQWKGAVVTIIIMITFISLSFGIINPHVEPANCESCHRKIPAPGEAGSGEYFLLKDTIDDTCHVCHEYTCCNVGSLHEKERNHPSNIKRWDVDKFDEPKNLPLFKGYITCNTCHYHRKPAGQDFKMVRMVKDNLDGDFKNWEDLCRDCHKEY